MNTPPHFPASPEQMILAHLVNSDGSSTPELNRHVAELAHDMCQTEAGQANVPFCEPNCEERDARINKVEARLFHRIDEIATQNPERAKAIAEHPPTPAEVDQDRETFMRGMAEAATRFRAMGVTLRVEFRDLDKHLSLLGETAVAT